jgi:hypothetical protein
MEPAGRDPGRAFGAPRSGASDALFPEEVQSFPDNFSARLGHESDDVGVGKTIEVGMIARELLDRGIARRLAVLTPAHLCD